MDDEPRIAVADFNGDGKADILANSQLDSYYDGAALLVNRGDGTFSQPIEYALGIPSFSRLAAADFNGDGRIDLASTTGASDYGPPEIQIHLNAGVSLFAVKTDYEGDLTRPGAVFAGDFDGNGRMDLLASTYVVGSQLFCFNADGTSSFTQLGNGSVIAVADLNADKKPDLIVSDGNLGVQLNNGDGTFGPTTFYLPGPQYYVPGIDVAIADFNGDGAPDIAASAYGTNVVQILRNNGYGSFVLAEQYAGAGSLVASDFNRDGRTDLIVSTDTGVQVLINKGSGLFAAGASYAIGSGAMITTDLNNDGLLDVVVSTDNGVVLLRGNGRGKFSVKNILPAAGNYGSIAAADFNGDGRTDLAVTGAVFLNRGNAQFAPGISFATGARSNFIITADFNGDGKPDLAWSNLYGNSVSVMLNGLD